jgi:hypothetical protein
MLHTLWNRLTTWMAGDRKSLLRRVLLSAVFVVPALVFIAYQTWRNWEQLRSYTWKLRPEFWALAFLAYSVVLNIELLAWNRMMGRLGGVSRFFTNARLYCISNLSKRLPGVVWYLAGRALLYREEGVPASVTLTGSALEFALMTATGPVVYLAALPWSSGVPSSWIYLAGAGALVAMAIVLQPAIFNRITAFVLRRLGSTAQLQVTYRDVLPLVPLYLAAWLVSGVVVYAVACSVYPLPLAALPTTIGIWAACGTLTLLISTFLLGFGMREVTLSLLLTVVMPQPMPVIVALVFGLLMVLFELSWTAIFALWRRRGRP